MKINEDLMTFKKAKKEKLDPRIMQYKLSLQDIKELLFTSHYPCFDTIKDYHIDCHERDFIIEEIADGYNGYSYSVFFSLKGSPPKGRAVFISGGSDRACGTLVFVECNRKPYTMKDVWITDFDDRLERRYKYGKS